MSHLTRRRAVYRVKSALDLRARRMRAWMDHRLYGHDENMGICPGGSGCHRHLLSREADRAHAEWARARDAYHELIESALTSTMGGK